MSTRILVLSCLALAISSAAVEGTPAFCSNHVALTSCLISSTAAAPFFQSFAHATTSVVTVTRTKSPATTVTFTEGTTATYVPSFRTLSSPTETHVITVSGQGTDTTTCSRTTLTPYTTTYVIPGSDQTVVYTFTGPNVKRDVATATVAPTPSCLSERPDATISAACSCLSLRSPTTTVTRTTRAPRTTAYATVTSGIETYHYPATTTTYSTTKTTTSTSYSATSTIYDLRPDRTYTVNKTTYEIYQDYRFDFNDVGVTLYSCHYGLCGLQPQPCKINDCPNGLTDCLEVCPYVEGCNAVLFEERNLNDKKTCAFINTRQASLSCGYVDELDDFGVRKRFALP